MSRPTINAGRLARRLMHTGGRRIPNPGEGGAPSHGSVSPHTTAPIPSTSTSTSTLNPSPTPSALSPAPRYNAKSRLIPSRPARSVPVTLANGDPEPTTYPPPREYFDTLAERRKSPHPLWQFFHVDSSLSAGVGAEQTGPRNQGSLEVLEGDDDNLRSGRAWTAAELRTKSFAELHTLWYVLVKERNILATQREERRRLNLHASEGGDLITKRTFRCRKSMARIKYVLNERRLGIMAVAEPDVEAELAADMAAELQEDGEGVEEDAVVQDGQVGREEVEARDEGFGGGQEAKEFVEDVKVDGGHVQKKE